MFPLTREILLTHSYEEVGNGHSHEHNKQSFVLCPPNTFPKLSSKLKTMENCVLTTLILHFLTALRNG